MGVLKDLDSYALLDYAVLLFMRLLPLTASRSMKLL